MIDRIKALLGEGEIAGPGAPEADPSPDCVTDDEPDAG
jgi:hypothetical protein